MTEKKIKQEVIDELMKEYRGPEDFQALFTALKKAVMERALNAELSAHLGYEKGEEKRAGESNHRNGSSGKTVLGESGAVRLEIPEIATVRLIPTDSQRPAPHRRDGSEDPVDVCAWDDGSGDPGAPEGAVRDRHFGRSDQLGDRCGDR